MVPVFNGRFYRHISFCTKKEDKVRYRALQRGVYVITHLPSHASSPLSSYSLWESLAHKTKNLCHFKLSPPSFSVLWWQQQEVNYVETRSRLYLLSEDLNVSKQTAIASMNLLLGVVSFFCRAEQPEESLPAWNGSARRFARKSWPLVNMVETVSMLETVLLLPALNQNETFSEKKKKKKDKNSASDRIWQMLSWCQGFGIHYNFNFFSK